MLVIDEADRILEQGFEEEMHQIMKLLPKERQTMLFSATQTKKVCVCASEGGGGGRYAILLRPVAKKCEQLVTCTVQ